VRAVGLHADVVVTVSRAYQTTCTLVRSGGESFCVDSPVFADELEVLPAIAEQAGFGVAGLLATHADWDHLLGRYAFAEAPLGCAETTAAFLVGHPGVAQRELRAFDDERFEVGAGRVNGRRQPGRAGADNHYFAVQSLLCHLIFNLLRERFKAHPNALGVRASALAFCLARVV